MAEHSEKKNDDVIRISIGKWPEKIRKNPWIIASIVLAVVLIIVIFMKGGSTSTTVASPQTVGQEILNLATSQAGGNVTLNSVQKVGNYYQVSINVAGNPYSVLVSLDGNYLLQQINPTAGSGSTTGGGSTTTTTSGPVNVSLDANTPVIGSSSAPVTVVEFADFSCPYCEAASGDNAQMAAALQQSDSSWQPIVTNLMTDYIGTGKVRFAVKYAYGHTGGHSAQLVAWCLNDQSSSLYWKFYPLAFSHQSADTENLTIMESVAQGIGADMTQLQSCINSGKYNDRFNTEQNEATADGVTGTPAFFIDGKLVEGAVPYSQFKQDINAELKNQSW